MFIIEAVGWSPERRPRCSEAPLGSVAYTLTVDDHHRASSMVAEPPKKGRMVLGRYTQ